MKAWVSAIFTTALALTLAGCGGPAPSAPQETQVKVYSFSGENERCSVVNGVAVMGPDVETLYGGNFLPTEEFADITAYTMSFSLSVDGKEDSLLVHSATDTTGSFELHNQEIGQISGDVFRDGTEDALLHTLTFTLETTNAQGETQTFSLPMDVTEITQNVSPN